MEAAAKGTAVVAVEVAEEITATRAMAKAAEVAVEALAAAAPVAVTRVAAARVAAAIAQSSATAGWQSAHYRDPS